MARLLLDDTDGTDSEISVFETWDTHPSLASPTLFLLLLLCVGEGKGSGEANVYYLCNCIRVTE